MIFQNPHIRPRSPNLRESQGEVMLPSTKILQTTQVLKRHYKQQEREFIQKSLKQNCLFLKKCFFKNVVLKALRGQTRVKSFFMDIVRLNPSLPHIPFKK